MGADRNQWQFPKNEANKIPGWRSDGKGLENKIVPLIGLSLASEIRDFLDTAPYVETRTALKALDTTKDTVAILKETGRDGVFRWTTGDYSALVAADTQEGVVIKADDIAATVGAWVRQHDGLINIEWFGCVGDDSTDNTTALQGAIAYSAALGTTTKKSLLIPQGVFKYTTLNIPPACLGLAIKGLGPRASTLQTTSVTAGAKIVIDTIGVSFEGLNIKGSTTLFGSGDPQSIIIQAKRSTNTVADLDIYFTNCWFSDSWYLFDSEGRGAVFDGFVFSNCRYGCNVGWPADGTYTEGSNWEQKKSTGFRRLVFRNGEVHAINIAAVRNLGANALNAQIEMADVFSESGDGLFAGMLGEGSHLHGLKVWGATGVPLYITGGERYTVESCVLMGTVKASEDGASTNILLLEGTHTNPTFRNLTLGYSQEHTINCASGSAVVGGVFENITFIEPALDGGSFDCLLFNGAGHTAECRHLIMVGATTRNSIVRGTSASSTINVVDATHLNGSTPPIKGSGTFSYMYLPVRDSTTAQRTLRGSSSAPEGSVTAEIGSIVTDITNGTLNVKRTGSGNTGWLPAAMYISGTATYDPPSLADGAGASTTVTVTGAELGDVALASFSLSTQGITVTANVTAANTVTVRFQNETGGVLDLASGTLKAVVLK